MPKGARPHGLGEAEAALAATVQHLRAGLDAVRRSQRTRAVIEQAKGLLAERLRCAPDEAFEQLTRLSQQTHPKVAEVAASLIGAAVPVPAHEDADSAVLRAAPYVGRPPGAPADEERDTPAVTPLPEETTARYHLTCSAMSAAEDGTAP